jgi:hypothetical protein
MSDDNETTYKTIDSLNQVDEQTIKIYWAQVEDTLKGSFKMSELSARSAIEQLRGRLAESPPDTQLYFYHSSPFQIAADLANRIGPFTLFEKENYINSVLKRPENDRPDREALQRLLPEDLHPRSK